MNLLARLGAMGCAVIEGRTYPLRTKNNHSLLGSCLIAGRRYFLEEGESLEVLGQYYGVSKNSPDSVGKAIQGQYQNLRTGRNLNSLPEVPFLSLSLSTPIIPTLPEPCVLKRTLVYGPGKGSHYLHLEPRSPVSLRIVGGIPSEYQGITTPQSTTVSTFLPSFQLTHNRCTYLFDATSISLDIKVSETLTLLSAPYVPKGYEHPIVWSNGTICYNGSSRWKELGIRFGTPLQLNEGIAQGARALFEAQSLLQSYFGNLPKVKDITRFSQRCASGT